jgi:hypothetical protein
MKLTLTLPVVQRHPTPKVLILQVNTNRRRRIISISRSNDDDRISSFCIRREELNGAISSRAWKEDAFLGDCNGKLIVGLLSGVRGRRRDGRLGTRERDAIYTESRVADRQVQIIGPPSESEWQHLHVRSDATAKSKACHRKQFWWYLGWFTLRELHYHDVEVQAQLQFENRCPVSTVSLATAPIFDYRVDICYTKEATAG